MKRELKGARFQNRVPQQADERAKALVKNTLCLTAENTLRELEPIMARPLARVTEVANEVGFRYRNSKV